MDRNHQNFFCSKDNNFSHYMGQRLKQQMYQKRVKAASQINISGVLQKNDEFTRNKSVSSLIIESPLPSAKLVNSTTTTQRETNKLSERYKQILFQNPQFSQNVQPSDKYSSYAIFNQRSSKRYMSDCKPNSYQQMSHLDFSYLTSQQSSQAELKPFLDRSEIEKQVIQETGNIRNRHLLKPSISQFTFDTFEKKFTASKSFVSKNNELSYMKLQEEILPEEQILRKRTQKSLRNEAENKQISSEFGLLMKKEEIQKFSAQPRTVRSMKNIAIPETNKLNSQDLLLPMIKSTSNSKLIQSNNRDQLRKARSQKYLISSNSVVGIDASIIKDGKHDRENEENVIESIQLQQELMLGFRYLKDMIKNDEEMTSRIKNFCFINLDEFCFLFGRFFDSIFSTSTYKEEIKSDFNERSICLQQAGVDRLVQLVELSFKKAKVQNLATRVEEFRLKAQELIPRTLLDELGGREFMKTFFVDFMHKIIESKEFLNEKHDENYIAILQEVKKNGKYLDLVCAYLASSPNDDLSVRRDIAEAIGMKISSIDFLVLKKWIYHYFKERCSDFLENVHGLVLRVISRLNQLRLYICNELVFIRNPENFHRHIFLTIKNLMSSSAFVKPPTTSQIQHLTSSLIAYITLETTSSEFLAVLNSLFKDISLQQNEIDLMELAVTQAYDIYSFWSLEDSADLAYKFEILRYRLGIKKHLIQLLPTQLSTILSELSEWVETKITEDPLPKEILLKNLEDTELLEIMIEFSRPEIDAFYHNDSFAAFSFYKITKMQFEFWMTGLEQVLRDRNTKSEDIQEIKSFLMTLFPGRSLSRKQSFKLNEHSEQIYEAAYKAASQQSIKIPEEQTNSSEAEGNQGIQESIPIEQSQQSVIQSRFQLQKEFSLPLIQKSLKQKNV